MCRTQVTPHPPLGIPPFFAARKAFFEMNKKEERPRVTLASTTNVHTRHGDTHEAKKEGES